MIVAKEPSKPNADHSIRKGADVQAPSTDSGLDVPAAPLCSGADGRGHMHMLMHMHMLTAAEVWADTVPICERCACTWHVTVHVQVLRRMCSQCSEHATSASVLVESDVELINYLRSEHVTCMPLTQMYMYSCMKIRKNTHTCM